MDEILLAKMINFIFQFVVEVNDQRRVSRQTDQASVTIEVDIDNNPRFISGLFISPLQETAKGGDSVHKLSAVDDDLVVSCLKDITESI